MCQAALDGCAYRTLLASGVDARNYYRVGDDYLLRVSRGRCIVCS